jgi:UDP-N-acetylmuramate: L-alanyl-gamma-D-glutamyl-meso-diaminopimelate ligase
VGAKKDGGDRRVHLIGICGTAMAALACMLDECGFAGSGSDAAAYPPMSEILRSRGIAVQSGYDEARIDPGLDLVVVGNVAAAANPESQRAGELGLRRQSLPETLWSEFLSSVPRRLVVAGTHGKTTTSSLLAWGLEHAGRKPSFMIGGELQNFAANYKLGPGAEFVLEGDEYNSAWFDRHAKFHHYHPTHLIITGIEMDHVDLFAGIDAIVAEFERLITGLASDSLLVAAADNPILARLSGRAPGRVVTYGWSPAADYRLSAFRPRPGGAAFSFRTPEGAEITLESAALGRHNAENGLAVAILLAELGLSWAEIGRGLTAFAGVKRRQEIVATCGESVYISDFAHHPTAIRRTLEALAEHYPGHRLLAVFEPRTATSRRNLFQTELEAAFTPAAEVLLAPVYGAEKLAPGERLDTGRLARALAATGRPARACSDLDELKEQLAARAGARDLVVLMSTGAFGGIFEFLKTGLKPPV